MGDIGSVSQLLLLSAVSNPDQLASVVAVNWDRSNSSKSTSRNCRCCASGKGAVTGVTAIRLAPARTMPVVIQG
ncbi:hypothetical protein [Mycobacterium sp.]|uniref:hypothetical protein n=1 Tax=Mycobacterium sp. TaxID=1785 RepID=UPI003BB5F2F7